MPHNSDRRSKRENAVLKDLAKYEYAVHEWVTRCRVNAIWFVSDPASALREANLGIDEALLARLECVPRRELTRLLRTRRQAS